MSIAEAPILSVRGLLKLFELLLPLTGQRQQRILSLSINHRRLGLAARQLLPGFEIAGDVLPQFEILRIWPSRVINRWQTRNLCDAAFNRIHEREVADDPGEWRTFRVAAAVQVKRRR